MVEVQLAGGAPSSAYIQVIPLNVAADDLQLVKTLLTSKNISSANPAIQITNIQTSTECSNQAMGIQCECKPGFHFDMTKCKFFTSCYVPPEIDSHCICSNMDSSSTAYCDAQPEIPGTVTLYPNTIKPGSDIQLEFSSTEDVSNIQWFMVNLVMNQVKEIHNGTRTTIMISSRKSTLTINNIPRDWEVANVTSHTAQDDHDALQIVNLTENELSVMERKLLLKKHFSAKRGEMSSIDIPSHSDNVMENDLEWEFLNFDPHLCEETPQTWLTLINKLRKPSRFTPAFGSAPAVLSFFRMVEFLDLKLRLECDGLYLCRFQYHSLYWEASHPVKFPLDSLDIMRNPEQINLWKNSTIFPGVTIECCIWSEGHSYHVFWEPGHIPSDAVERDGQQCYPLSIRTIPEQDTYYRCVFQDSTNEAVESGVHVLVIQIQDVVCPGSSDGMWRTTKARRQAEIACPSGKRGKITRSCLKNGQWGSPKDKCRNARLLFLLKKAQWLRDGLGIPEVEVSGLIETLRNYTFSSQQFVNNSWDIITVVDMMKTISVTALENNIKFNLTVMADIFFLCSQMLDYSLETTWMDVRLNDPTIGSSFLQFVENFAQCFNQNEDSFSLIYSYFQVNIEYLDGAMLTGYNHVFNTTLKIEVTLKKVQNQVMGNKFTVASILIQNLSSYLPTNFGGSLEGYHHRVSNYIVMNKILSNQSMGKVDVQIVFERSLDPNDTDTGVAQCVTWDYDLFEGTGGWSTEGCKTSHGYNTTVCRCKRLTAISVLRMSSSVPKDDPEDEYLEYTIQVCLGLSITCLVICNIACIVQWKTDVKDDISFYRQVAFINICLSLLIADTSFFSSTFINESQENQQCLAAAFFQHLFYMATFFWMLLQGLILLHQLAPIFHQPVRRIVIPVMMTIGYICPLIIAIATISIDYPKGEYIGEEDCFLNGDAPDVFAFSGPVLLVIFINFFIIGVIVWKILRPSESESHEEDRKALVARALSILTSVFGVTWILETATVVEEANEYFHYALTIINSLQGVFFLICGCLDKKVMEAISDKFQSFLDRFPNLRCHEKSSYNMFIAAIIAHIAPMKSFPMTCRIKDIKTSPL
ncbi:adhesion G-protein coupled receptor F3 [Gastrophryne carolinensis]